MFETLIESKPQRARSFKQTLFSLVLHVVLIYGAIKATAGAAEVLKEIIQDTTMVFLKPPEPPPPSSSLQPTRPTDAPSKRTAPKAKKLRVRICIVPVSLFCPVAGEHHRSWWLGSCWRNDCVPAPEA